MSRTKARDRSHWLWVTRPEYYLDEQGNDRSDLDPARAQDAGGYWTCHKNTRAGDLALLWRTSPKRDIGYLIKAASDAYSIADEDYASAAGWDYGCDYRVLYRFQSPITIEDLRQDPRLQEWGALGACFRRRVFSVDDDIWNRLNQLAAAKNRGYRTVIEKAQQARLVEAIDVESRLEETLANDLGRLQAFGHALSLFVDAAGKTGRQYVCTGHGGRIDLLCYDSRRRRFVVIELKNVRAGRTTFGQIASYMGWVEERIAGGKPVVGLVISRGFDVDFQSAMKTSTRISHIDIADLGFS
jgi:hypothetical protein